MDFLLDPNVAYVLLVGGLVVAILALFSPGTGLLEVGALFMLVLAGYSIANQAINWWALVLLVVGIVPFLLAVRKSKQWIFLALALAVLVVGSVFLIRDEQGRPAINLLLALFVSLVAVGLLWLIGRRSLEAMGKPPAFDLNRLGGMTGVAHTAIHLEGSAYVNGEEWSARSETLIPARTRIRVLGREGLILLVEALPDKQKTGSS
jgi:membrane-bound ClpP family serine protease